MKKIQINEQDIMRMVRMGVKSILREVYGNDAEVEIDPVLYNPTTGKFGFVHGNIKEDAAKLGDGVIYVCRFEADGTDYEDTSFSYDYGMENGIHHEGHNNATSVRFDGVDDAFRVLNGQVVDYDESELGPEDIRKVEEFANRNIDSLRRF